jgi:hypothetical protein
VADRGKDDVGCIALATLEMTVAELSVGLHVTDHRFDSRAAVELAFDHSEDATLARDFRETSVRLLNPVQKHHMRSKIDLLGFRPHHDRRTTTAHCMPLAGTLNRRRLRCVFHLSQRAKKMI